MAKNFHFDFNEDADPVDELHRLRVATSRHFKTMKARLEDLRKTPTAQEMLARLDAEIAEKKAKEAKIHPVNPMVQKILDELDAKIARKKAKEAAKAASVSSRQSPAPRRQAPASRRRRAAAHA